MQQRVRWVDVTRGFGIGLVVVGHAIGAVTRTGLAESSGWREVVVDWIYAFHMPLFFFVSGLFLASSLARGFGALLRDKLRTIAWPYLLWATLQTALQMTGGGNFHASWRDIVLIPIVPPMQFWFLYALFGIMVLLAALSAWRVSTTAALAISLGLHLLSRWWIPPWGVARSIEVDAVWVALGLSSSPFVLGRTYPRWQAAALAIVGFSVVTFAVGFPELRVIAGIAGSLGLGCLIARSRGLELMGRRSLEIFVAHSVAMGVLRKALMVVGVRQPTIHLLALTAFGIGAPLALAELARRANLNWLFVFPKTTGKIPGPVALPPPSAA